MMSNKELGGEPLVVCAICESVVTPKNAERRLLETPSGNARVWICKACMRLGRGEQVRKYVMKKEKQGIGRQSTQH